MRTLLQPCKNATIALYCVCHGIHHRYRHDETQLMEILKHDMRVTENLQMKVVIII